MPRIKKTIIIKNIASIYKNREIIKNIEKTKKNIKIIITSKIKRNNSKKEYKRRKSSWCSTHRELIEEKIKRKREKEREM